MQNSTRELRLPNGNDHSEPDLVRLKETCLNLQTELDNMKTALEEKEAEIDEYAEELEKVGVKTNDNDGDISCAYNVMFQASTEVSNLSYLLDNTKEELERCEDELASFKGDPNSISKTAEASTKLYEKDQELKKVRYDVVVFVVSYKHSQCSHL
jgi:DNA repair exonuclease SbcCD ATPase subunit